MGHGSPDRKIKMEVGVIDEVMPEKGECRVITEHGRVIENARITQPMGTPEGYGMRLTPQANTRCLIAMAETDQQRSIRGDDAYVIRTLRTPDVKGESGDWGAPGDFTYEMPNAGRFLVSQSGVVDIKSDPWARISILPEDCRIKTKVKNFEKIYSPLAQERTIHDESTGEAFHEMFLNSGFLHREGDSVPDIMWAAGQTSDTELSSNINPDTDFLSWFKTEERNDQGQTQQRYLEMSGGVEGVISKRKAEDLNGGTVFQQELGNQSGLLKHEVGKTRQFEYDEQIGDQNNLFLQRTMEKQDVKHKHQIGKKTKSSGEIERTVIKTAKSEETERRGLFGSRLYRHTWKKGGQQKFDIDLKDSGRLKVENPSWTIDIEEGKKATVKNGTTTITVDDDQITINSGSTELDIDAGDIYVGGSSGSEAIAKGETLKDILKQMKKWMNTHIHPHPVGPTSAPATPFQAPLKFLSKSNYVN